MSEPIRVTEVRGRRDLKQFLDLPERIYARDPNWVAPLRREVRKLLDRRRNPFFDHGEACFWIARRGETPVGRISAQVNRLHLETHRDATGNLGSWRRSTIPPYSRPCSAQPRPGSRPAAWPAPSAPTACRSTTRSAC